MLSIEPQPKPEFGAGRYPYARPSAATTHNVKVTPKGYAHTTSLILSPEFFFSNFSQNSVSGTMTA